MRQAPPPGPRRRLTDTYRRRLPTGRCRGARYRYGIVAGVGRTRCYALPSRNVPRHFRSHGRALVCRHFLGANGVSGGSLGALAESRHTLVAAPTGSGKTLAAFLTAISDLAKRARAGTLTQVITVLYVSPLKALSNDIQRNLEQPLAAIQALLAAELGTAPAITTAVRTGDTPPAARALMRKRSPHMLVTTPESLYLLLTSAGGRALLATVESVVIDEIHALVTSKRGAHLALSLARLAQLTGRPLLRIGLSATQRPLARVAEFVTGRPHGGGAASCCAIVEQHSTIVSTKPWTCLARTVVEGYRGGEQASGRA